jgi:ABC-type lipoprotein release transport system permease subunit
MRETLGDFEQMVSFTVARRRKEIGIRAALGADPSRILAGIFSRALAQLAAGAAVGLAGAIALENDGILTTCRSTRKRPCQ